MKVHPRLSHHAICRQTLEGQFIAARVSASVDFAVNWLQLHQHSPVVVYAFKSLLSVEAAELLLTYLWSFLFCISSNILIWIHHVPQCSLEYQSAEVIFNIFFLRTIIYSTVCAEWLIRENYILINSTGLMVNDLQLCFPTLLALLETSLTNYSHTFTIGKLLWSWTNPSGAQVQCLAQGHWQMTRWAGYRAHDWRATALHPKPQPLISSGQSSKFYAYVCLSVHPNSLSLP